jgi:predicted MFS family arabinose efflux permease
MQPAVPYFVVAMLLGGLAFIMLHTTLQTRATEIAPAVRATGISLFAFSLFLGSSVGALVVAQVIDAVGYTEMMLGVAAACAGFTVVATLAVVPWSQPDHGPVRVPRASTQGTP